VHERTAETSSFMLKGFRNFARTSVGSALSMSRCPAADMITTHRELGRDCQLIAAESRVARAIDLAHAARAERRHDFVLA
jgi:hypothetical protein